MSLVPPEGIPQNHVVSSDEVVISPAASTSPSEPTLCLMIDNYDSFTFNLYQYLCQLGADMSVKRNDEITIEEIQKLYEEGKLRSIVISPGPGHPRTDSGVSRDVITWAAGKVPLLGVCMGLECMVDVLGGEIAYAGEILHGKTSLVNHDSLGIFHSLPQALPSTRYHSLSASILSLPACLQVTATTSESGVVMGIRHRQYTMEAVQYHPESVMSEGGRELLANFLKLKGGKWGGENEWCGCKSEEPKAVVVNGDGKKSTNPAGSEATLKLVNGNAAGGASKQATGSPSLPTILNNIHVQRLKDIAASESIPSTSSSVLKRSIAIHAAPPITPLIARINQTFSAHPAVMAEIKRASPSKGNISVETNAPEQAIKYALAGASVISVLTEPKWFKGALSDLLSVRLALDSMPNRPALLRKDFILSTYQIDEARLHGADTVLLIVAMLKISELKELYAYSVSLGMEPLVEVNNAEELSIALDIGSKVIGVNNRNLHDFNVDMGTTSRLADVLRERGREDVILCALSGITGREDVEKYVAQGVKAVLVGEALMRAADPGSFIRDMLDIKDEGNLAAKPYEPLVKICGIRNFEDAKAAVDLGADLLGLIFANTKRKIDFPTARRISAYAHSVRFPSDDDSAPPAEFVDESPLHPSPWFKSQTKRISSGRKPLLVGVFQNQPLSYVQWVASSVPLDVVQLHGDEPQEWANQISVPVIKAFRVAADRSITGGQVDRQGANELILLDAAGKAGSAGGGEGLAFDWSVAANMVKRGEPGAGSAFPLPIILAGGLNPENVTGAVEAVRPWCVDVSSGTELEGGSGKDHEKIRAFIRNAKGGPA